MINERRLINTFIDCVKIDSETGNEKRFAAYLETILVTLGFSIFYDHVGEVVGCNSGNLIAKKKGTIDGHPILLSAHLDTVNPGIDIKPIIEDGIIKSDGTTILGGDDKAGISAILEAVKTIIEKNLAHPDIEIFFPIAEEIGLKGSAHFDIGLLSAKAGYVIDSGKDIGTIISSAPSETTMDIYISGKRAHAGVEPEKGISALLIAAEAINKMKLMRIDEETTANIGIINGGNATNIVMPELYLRGEARSLNEEKLTEQLNHMKNCFEEAATKFGGEVRIELQENYKTYQVTERDFSVAKAIKVFEKLNIEPTLLPTGGGSDVNNLRQKGVDCVNIGMGVKGAHTLNEHIAVSDLVKLSTFIYESILSWH